MNSNLITSKEERQHLVDYLESLGKAIDAKTDAKLVRLAGQVFKGRLSSKQISKMCAMSYNDKLWLIAQYEEEVKYNTPPNFDHLY